MFYTVTGTSFKVKNNASKEEIINAVHKKLKANKESIFIYNNFIGFFNTKEEICDELNMLKEYGVPDNINCSKKTVDEFLDYKNVRIVKSKNVKKYLEGFDTNEISQIFKHLLCEEDAQVKLDEQVDLEKYNLMFFEENNVRNEDKQIICDNMKDIVKNIFNK